MPEADLSDAKKRVSALQPPVRPAASRHKKDSKNKFYQIVQSSMPIHSVQSHPGIKKGPAARVAAGPLQDGDYLLSHLRSTIGVTKLNFSVRNGKRWNLRAIVT